MDRTAPELERRSHLDLNLNPPTLGASQQQGSRFHALAEVDQKMDLEGTDLGNHTDQEGDNLA